MGLIINSTKMGMPYINGIKNNAYINGQKMWNNPESFEFVVEDAGSFGIPVSGVNGGETNYQSYDWKIKWGDGSIETVSGTSGPSATSPHTYSSGGTHTITITPNGKATQGWFNAFGSSSSQDASNLAKIKELKSSITSRMRTMNTYAFEGIFRGCTGLTSLPADLLPATNLGSGYCYRYAFYGCTGLTSLPSGFLPATTAPMYCYYYMFFGCTGLKSLPSDLLPATTLGSSCYQYMFYGCKGLTSLPAGLLPATTVNTFCYRYMFVNCTGLTTLPNNLLPATTLLNSCYVGMFNGATSLTNIGNIDAAWFSDRSALPQATMFTACTKIATPITYANIPAGWK
jgi:hypothetical protein